MKVELDAADICAAIAEYLRTYLPLGDGDTLEVDYCGPSISVDIFQDKKGATK